MYCGGGIQRVYIYNMPSSVNTELHNRLLLPMLHLLQRQQSQEVYYYHKLRGAMKSVVYRGG